MKIRMSVKALIVTFASVGALFLLMTYSFINQYQLMQSIEQSLHEQQTIQEQVIGDMKTNANLDRASTHLEQAKTTLYYLNVIEPFLLLIIMGWLLGATVYFRRNVKRSLRSVVKYILSKEKKKITIQEDFQTVKAAIDETTSEFQNKVSELSDECSKYKIILDTLVDGFITISKEGIILSFNKAAERIFGYQASEVIDNNIKMLMPDKYAIEHDGYLSNYLRTNVARAIGREREVKGRTKTGEEFALYISVSEVKINNKIVFTGLLRDISKEREAERKLQESNKVLEAQNWLKTRVATITEKIQSTKDIANLGDYIVRTLSEATRSGHGAFYCKSTSDDDNFKLSGAYALSQRKNIVNLLEPGEGLLGQAIIERRPILLTKVPEDYVTINSSLGEGNPLSIIAVPAVLKEADKEEVIAIFELASFEFYTEQHLMLLNEVANVLAVHINALVSYEKNKNLLVESNRLATELEAQQAELKATNDELENQAEHLRQSEEALRVSNEELEEKMHELEEQKKEIEKRNKELDDARQCIEDKANELQQSSQYKTEFLANMSHELRTPLNSLLILAQDLMANNDGNLTSDQLEAASIIYSGGQELSELINDILDLSKVEAGKLIIIEEDVDVEQLAQNLKQQFSPVANKKELEFSVNINAGVPKLISTDKKRLKQIIKNLLSNAFKFTAAGSVSVDISLAENNQLKISVKDSGIGILPEKIKHIFEAFTQEDGTTCRKYGGTGLGLTISRELSRLLGGTIHVNSQEGKGSEFYLLIPVNGHVVDAIENNTTITDNASEHHSEAMGSTITQAIEEVEHCAHEKPTLLIVEDDEKFGKILEKISSRRGYQTILTTLGKDALEIIEAQPVSAVILDLGLPDLDGMKVLDAIKSNSKTRHIPIHIVSGRDEDDDFMRKGAVGFLTKPANFDQIDCLLAKFEPVICRDIQRILVVEDDDNSQKAIKTILKKKQVDIDSAHSGAEAKSKIQSQHYDCIILDLGLPDMTGFGFLKQASTNAELELPPVVIYTGRDLTRDEAKILSQYTQSIVIKGDKSQERLVDEVSMFLHSVETPHQASQLKREISVNKDNLLKDKKILLVDDDVRNTFALSRALNQTGIKIVLADNGRVAIDKLDENPDVDMVLMDIMMPIMDGFEAIERIRKDPRHDELPIIALTAKSMQEDKARCMKVGANDYMLKPIDTEKLVSMIKIHFGKQ